MEQDLIQNLKRLQSIQPNAEFKQKSRAVVLAMRPIITPKRSAWFFVPAYAFAALLLVGLSNVPRQVNTQTAFDAGTIKQEFNDLSINIELKEISYDQKANEVIASALSKISDSNN